MKTLLAFIRINDFMTLDECRIRSNEYDRVVMVVCDKSVGICHWNPCGDHLKCRHCKHIMMSFVKPILKENKKFMYLNFSDLVDEEIIKEASSVHFEYNNVSELKNIKYHEVDVGFGAFSTFVTYTLNVMPTFNETLHDYLNTLMRSEIRMTLVWERLIKQFNPELVIFHNGRFNEFKPLYCIVQNKGIHYIATETITIGGEMKKNNFDNTIPHAFDAFTNKINLAAERCGDELGEVGRAFFENRRAAKPAGDKIYVKDQVSGMLPEGFDGSKCNIAIFNSSEDESYSLSFEFDRSRIYENQYVGLTRIFEKYKDNLNIHFYLRIHPRLKIVPYKSHTNLYKLNYDNVTIIPPTSPISSYALLDACEKIIVFGSTIGLEASYWGKPVITLSRSFYSDFNLVYAPKDEEEAFELIEKDTLPPLGEKKDFYKVAAFLMGHHADDFIYYKQRIINYHGSTFALKKLLGSYKLNKLVENIIDKFSKYHGNGHRFYKLGERTK